MSQTLAPDDKLVIILDQFEELFLRVGSRNRTAFFAELSALLTDPTRTVRVTFALREDYPHLDEARSHFLHILSHGYRLTALERRSARAAITEPAGRAGISVEPALVDALVGAEGRRRSNSEVSGDLVESDGHILLAALQIVLDRLYREALPADHDIAAPPPTDLTLHHIAYQRIERCVGNGDGAKILRGTVVILAGYVDEGLAHLPRLKQADGSSLNADPALGEAILKVMITSQATKAALSQAEILDELDEGGLIAAADDADRKLVQQPHLGLERARLLRGFERDSESLYELAHDHLAAEMACQMNEAELIAKLACEMLRREMDNYRGSDDKILIQVEILALIHEQRESLKRLKQTELEWLFRSALNISFEVLYWFKKARASGVAVNELALSGLQNDNFRVRAAAVTALSELGDGFIEPITKMLADDYPQVRVAAIGALEKLGPSGAWHHHLKYECYVPAGEFIMGDDNSDNDEKPTHQVNVEAFYCGKYPVTNADYHRYQTDLGRQFEIPNGKADHPVANVSWYNARDYAAWGRMCLPT